MVNDFLGAICEHIKVVKGLLGLGFCQCDLCGAPCFQDLSRLEESVSFLIGSSCLL